jgi:hypothetical protein
LRNALNETTANTEELKMADLVYTAVYNPDGEIEKKPQGWDVVGGRVQPLPGENEIEVEAEQSAEPDIEVVYERPGRSGEEAIEALQRQYEEAKAQKEAADQRARELEGVVQFRDHKSALQQAYAAEVENYNQANRRYTQFFNEGNHCRGCRGGSGGGEVSRKPARRSLSRD